MTDDSANVSKPTQINHPLRDNFAAILRKSKSCFTFTLLISPFRVREINKLKLQLTLHDHNELSGSLDRLRDTASDNAGSV